MSHVSLEGVHSLGGGAEYKRTEAVISQALIHARHHGQPAVYII